MKDEHDKRTIDFVESVSHAKPVCMKVHEISPGLSGQFVPVSFVASDWKVTARRIRALLSAGRLAGRLQENGYWEVLYPYSVTLGKRGPVLRRQQWSPDRPKKSEGKPA